MYPTGFTGNISDRATVGLEFHEILPSIFRHKNFKFIRLPEQTIIEFEVIREKTLHIFELCKKKLQDDGIHTYSLLRYLIV